MALTKSLHTVTSATAVARHLVIAGVDAVGAPFRWSPALATGDVLASAALLVLGHAVRPEDMARDVTAARIVASCERILATGGK